MNKERFGGSEAADTPGSRNYAGIKDPVIDELVERIIEAKNRGELIVATKALDRVLQWGYYLIPSWHINNDRVIWWDKIWTTGYQAGVCSGVAKLVGRSCQECKD